MTGSRHRSVLPSLDPTVFWAAMGLFVGAFVLGGASRENELRTMVVELAAVPVLAAAIWQGARSRLTGLHILPIALIVGMCLTPVLQLLPTPPAFWSLLPGRELSKAIFEVADLPQGSGPVSLTPDGTIRSLLWLIPPVALFGAVLAAGVQQRVWLASAALGLCVVSLILGGIQISDREASLFRLYPTTHAGLPVGLFANRNHQGIAMVAGIPFAAVLAGHIGEATADRRRLKTIIYACLVGLLMTGVLVTRSRAALILSGPALLASFAIFWAGGPALKWRRGPVMTIGATIVLLVVVSQFALAAVLARFDSLAEREGRFEAWPTIIAAAAPLQPVGAGLGSFDVLYRSAEPVKLLSPYFFNHAHNDYLELWLETGIIFPILFVLFAAWFFKSSIRAWRGRASKANRLARAASVVLLLLLLHSIADYPLRTQALACLAALSAACLIPSPQPRSVSRR